MKKKILGVIICLTLLAGCQTAKLEDGKSSVVTFKEGGISAETLFESLKSKYGTETIINLIDTELLSREYTTESDSEKAYIEQYVKTYKNEWKDNFESNLSAYFGVSSEKEFREFLKLSYRRNMWTTDYAQSIVTDTEINDYYKDSLVGDITASHILIKSNATDSMTDKEKKAEEEKALNLAKEIIAKLGKGEKFESLAKEYSDDTATSEKGGKLEVFNDRSSYDANFLKEAIKLEVGKYSKEPVKSQYGYHIIYKTKQETKPELSKVKESIIKKIASEKISSDSSFTSKALVALREKYEMKITDTTLKNGYDKVYNN